MNSTPALRTLGGRTVTARRIAAACGAGVLLLGASACGSSDPKNTAAGTGNQGTNSYGGPATTQQGGQRPGADGKVAAVSGRTAQVQSQQSGQVAVSWTTSTTFTKEVSAKLADIKVGDCVLVTSAATAAGNQTAQPTAVTATAVRITPAVGGSCTPTGGPAPGGAGGPQLQGNGGGNSYGGPPPAGGQAPGGRSQFRGLGGAFGTVKSVTARGFVVESVRPTGTSTTEKTDVTVTVTRATTYSTTAKGSGSDVKVGVCVRADGPADDTGAIAAKRIQITEAVNGECGGFMRVSVNGSGPGATTQVS